MDIYSNTNAEPVLHREMEAVTLSTDRRQKQPMSGLRQTMTQCFSSYLVNSQENHKYFSL